MVIPIYYEYEPDGDNLKRLFYRMITGILAAVLLVCGYLLYGNLSAQSKFNSDIDTLTQLIAEPEHTYTPKTQSSEETMTILSEPNDVSMRNIPARVYTKKDEGFDTTDISPDYSTLYSMNADFAGWLTIEGTIVDYPVMQTKEEPYYYLRRDFNKSYSQYGLPFIAADCDLENQTDNILIYGHNMRDGSVFGALMAYEDPAFCEQNPIIRFDTLDESHEYQIWAVFKTTVSEEGFPYYHYIDLERPEVFDEFAEAVRAVAIYSTDVTPDYHARLLTLSTCETSVTDGRFVIVAQQRQIADE